MIKTRSFDGLPMKLLVGSTLLSLVRAAESGGNDTNCTQEAGEERESFLVLYFLFLTLSVGALMLYLQPLIFPRIPYAVKIFVLAIFLGTAHEATERKLGDLSDSIEIWTNISPHLVLAIFIPALVFSDAMRLDMHMLGMSFYQCLWLAGPLTLLTVVVLGALAKKAVPEWSWYLSMTFGASLGASDPIAVVAVVEPIQAPQTLKMILSGESHMGDLVSLLMFILFLELTTGGEYAADELALFILQMLLAGIVVGFLIGSVGLFLVSQSSDRTSTRSVVLQLTVTVCVAYFSFVVSENNLKSNGIISVFVSAIIFAYLGWPFFASIQTMKNVWEVIEYFANTIVFALGGLLIGKLLWINGEVFDVVDYLWIFALYATIIFVRLCFILATFPLLEDLGYGLDIREALFVSWCGIRGSVALALGIVVELEVRSRFDEKEASRFIFYVGGVVFLLLTVNSIFAGYLLAALGLNKTPEVKKQLLKYVEGKFRARALEAYVQVANLQKYENHSVDIIKQQITSLKMIREGDIIKEIQRKIEDDELDDDEEEMEDAEIMFKVEEELERFKSKNQTQQVDGIPIVDDEEDEEDLEQKSEKHDSRRKSIHAFHKALLHNTKHDHRLLAQIRGVFLKAVEGCYWEQSDDGILPRGSRVMTRLLSSVAFALDETEQGLTDLKQLSLPFDRFTYANSWHVRILEKLATWLPTWMFEIVGYRLHIEVVHDGVYMASLFVEAHTRAGRLIHEYLGKTGDESRGEVVRVISESRQEIQSAQDYLKLAIEVDPEVVELVQSKKLASMVLERQRRFAEKLRAQGILSKQDHYDLNKHIRRDLRRLKQLTTRFVQRVRVDSEGNNGKAFNVRHKLSALTNMRASFDDNDV